MNTKEKMAVMHAYLDGKTIEVMAIEDDKFREIPYEPTWNWGQCIFRVKPEPQEWWINVYQNQGFFHSTKAGAAEHLTTGGRTVHVREVME